MKLDLHKNTFLAFLLCIGLFSFLPEANAQTKVEILPLDIRGLKGTPVNPSSPTSATSTVNVNNSQLVLLLQSLANAIVSLQTLSPSAATAYSSTLVSALQTIQQYLSTGGTAVSSSTTALSSVNRKYSDMLYNAEEAYLVLESLSNEAVNSDNSKFFSKLKEAKDLYDLAKADFSAKKYEESYTKAISSIEKSHEGIIIAQDVIVKDVVDHADDVISGFSNVILSKTPNISDVYYTIDLNFANKQLSIAKGYLVSAEKDLASSKYRLAFNNAKLAIETITVAKSLLDWK